MAANLISCNTAEHRLYDAHPVLQAVFDFPLDDDLRTVWSLPRSLDDYIFDPHLLEKHADSCWTTCKQDFQQCIQQGNTEDAFHFSHKSFETTFSSAAVTMDGLPQTVAKTSSPLHRSSSMPDKEIGMWTFAKVLLGCGNMSNKVENCRV